jgi:hypothetical protein
MDVWQTRDKLLISFNKHLIVTFAGSSEEA